MDLLGSVFDEEHDAAVRNALACVLLRQNLVDLGYAQGVLRCQRRSSRLCMTTLFSCSNRSFSLQTRLSRSVFDAEDTGVIRFRPSVTLLPLHIVDLGDIGGWCPLPADSRPKRGDAFRRFLPLKPLSVGTTRDSFRC